MEFENLTGTIIGCAMKVHSTLGPGFLESVYQNALAHELRKAGLKVDVEYPIKVVYDGVPVGRFSADLFVQDCVMIENKAVQSLSAAHEVQLVNYLTATGVEVGILLNFGSARLEVKRKHRTYRAKARQDEQEQQDGNTSRSARPPNGAGEDTTGSTR